MKYLMLTILIASDVTGIWLLKLTRHFTRLIPSILCILTYAVCYYTFSHLLERMNMGIAYALWSGIGLIATNVIAYFAFGQKLTAAGVVGMILILTGCVLVNVWGTAA